MATAPTAGYIYLIESDAVDNDDWITDHAGDPDLLDLDQYTEGTEYCKLEIPRGYTKTFSTGVQVTDVGGGTSYDLRFNKRAYRLLASGIETSVSNADTIEKFCMIDRHTSGASATFKRYYLVIYFGVNTHAQFVDNTGTWKSYCKGIVTGGAVTWNELNPKTATIKLNFRSVWS